MRKIAVFSLLFGFLPLLALAQNPSCFDYYKFQSVEIDFHGEKQVYKAGEGAKFIGFLTNKNGYPLVDGTLVLRISKLDPRSQVGNDIIDEWTAKDNINLMAGEKQFASLLYQLPSGLPTGTYVLTSYFLTQDKFNISGLSFTDDIYGGYTTFSVEGRSEKTILFDRSGVKADGNAYRIFGFLPKAFDEKTQTIVVSVPLKNETNKSLKASVTYSLYAWDGMDKSNLIKSWNESLTIAANSQKVLAFDAALDERPVYFLKIKAQAGDQQSEIHVRLVKNGFRPRLNFVGITQFPTGDKSGNTLFACYHNTANAEANGKLELAVKNQTGRVLSDTTFSGKITGAIDVMTKDISNLRGYDKLLLSAKLYDDKNNLVDESDISYDCAKFSGDLCIKRSFNIYFFGAGFILIIAALYFIRKHFRKEEAQTL